MREMTIASEIQRLQGAKADMQISIGNKGVTVPSTAKLDEYAGYIDQIQQGSPEALIYYFTGILSINSNTVYIGNQDHVDERYIDYSWTEGHNLHLIRPYEYYDYSSGGHSTYKTYVSCIGLPKGASASVNTDLLLYEGADYTVTYIDYYYIFGYDIKFYLRITGGSQTVYVGKTVTFENGVRSVADFSWDGSQPSRTGGNYNAMKTTVVGTQGSGGHFLYQWKIN